MIFVIEYTKIVSGLHCIYIYDTWYILDSIRVWNTFLQIREIYVCVKTVIVELGETKM